MMVRRGNRETSDAVRIVNECVLQDYQLVIANSPRAAGAISSWPCRATRWLVTFSSRPSDRRCGSEPVHDVGLAPMGCSSGVASGAASGSTLVNAGLDACRAADHDSVVVLGHPAFYRKFGFVTPRIYGLSCEYPAPRGVFAARSSPGPDRSGGVHAGSCAKQA